MQPLKLFFICLLGLLAVSCGDDDDVSEDVDGELTVMLRKKGGSLDYYKLPDSNDYDNIPQDPKNPLTRTKVELGKLLFHETALAFESNFPESINTYSCASCHHAGAGFQANLPQGIGDGGIGFGDNGEARIFNPLCDETKVDVQPIRSPSTLNIAYQTNILWNGQFGATAMNEGTEANWTVDTPKAVNHLGFEGTETQAIAGLSVHRFGLSISEDFISSTEYKELFDVAFFDIDTSERYSKVTAGLAIAAYERTTLANESNFQKWLRGDKNAMSDLEKEGAYYFFSRNCSDCHNGPALNSMDFHAYGMGDLINGPGVMNVDMENTAHLGRGGFTGNLVDNYKFKVPQLYNLKDSKFYGHGSTFQSIKDVITYKNDGVKQNESVTDSQLAEQFAPMNMTPKVIDRITLFIEESLYDPNLKRYEPSSLPSGNCFPNNDALSKVDLDCI